jgi:hypothetical protein
MQVGSRAANKYCVPFCSVMNQTVQVYRLLNILQYVLGYFASLFCKLFIRPRVMGSVESPAHSHVHRQSRRRHIPLPSWSRRHAVSYWKQPVGPRRRLRTCHNAAQNLPSSRPVLKLSSLDVIIPYEAPAVHVYHRESRICLVYERRYCWRIKPTSCMVRPASSPAPPILLSIAGPLPLNNKRKNLISLASNSPSGFAVNAASS